MLFYCMGFGLTVSWLWVSYLNGPLLEYAVHLPDERETLFAVFMFANAVAYFAISHSKFCQRLMGSSQAFAGGALLMAASVLLLFFASSTGSGAAGLSFACNGAAVLGGAGATICLSIWLEKFALLAVPLSGLAFALGIAVAATCTMAGYLLLYVPAIVTVVTALMPVAAAVLHRKFCVSRTGSEPESCRFTAAAPYPRRFIILVLLLYIAGAQIFKLTVLDQEMLTSFWLSNATYGIVCLTAGLFMYRQRTYRVAWLYRSVLPLMTIGFFSVPLFLDRAPLLPFLLLQAGAAFFDMYTWLYVAYAASRSASPYAVIGQGMSMITGAILIGEMTGGLLRELTPVLSYLNTVVLVGGSVSLYATLFFREEDQAGRDDRQQPGCMPELQTSVVMSSGAGHVTAILPLQEGKESGDYGRLARHYKLTPKETEILALLAKGRNGTYIRDKLAISEHTVKFHLRNIYGKMGVKNRQELLRLLDDET